MWQHFAAPGGPLFPLVSYLALSLPKGKLAWLGGLAAGGSKGNTEPSPGRAMLRCQAWSVTESLPMRRRQMTLIAKIGELHLHAKHSEPVFPRILQLLAPPWLASFSLSLVQHLFSKRRCFN